MRPKVIKVSRHRHNRHHRHPIESLSSSKSRIIPTSIRATSSDNSVGTSKVHPTSCETHPSSAKATTIRDNSHRTIIPEKICLPDIFTATDRMGTTNDYHKTNETNKKKKYSRFCMVCSVVTTLTLVLAITGILLALLVKPESVQKNTTSTIDPCVTRIFWDKIGSIYAGNGTQGFALNQLSSPTGIFIDADDSLYINDNGNFRSLKYSSGATTGVLVAGGTSGNALNQFNFNIRLNYVDSNKGIYVADTSNHRVMHWANGASTGVLVAGDGTPGSTLNQVRSPYGVWVDSNSNVYVAEYQNHRVTKWSPGATAGIVFAGGNGQGSAPNQLSNPSGLVYDESNQDLYITNAFSNTVMKWRMNALNGTIVAGIAGTTGSSASLLSNPVDLKLDRWRNIYVLDRGNSRVQLFCNGDSTGITISGTGSGSSNLISPYSVALDSQLNLYVSENAFARVTKFSKL